MRLKSSNSHFALKSIKKDYITRHRDQRHVDNEKAVLLQVTSQFCIRLFGAFQDNSNVYFAMELAAGGELFRRLSKKESFRPAVAKVALPSPTLPNPTHLTRPDLTPMSKSTHTSRRVVLCD